MNRVNKKRKDLIQRVCEGADRQFGNKTCDDYIHYSRECRLLKASGIYEYWEKCRYSFQLLHDAVKNCLLSFKRKYRGLPIDEQEDIEFEKIIARLKKQKLKHGYNLLVLRQYINRTVYLEIRNTLAQKGFVPGKTCCGACCHLSGNRPYTCFIKDEKRNKSDDICTDYKVKFRQFISINQDDNTQKLKSLTAEIEKAGCENVKTAEAILEAGSKKKAIAVFMEQLHKRVENEKPGSKKRNKYERQYHVFINLYHLFAEEVPKGKAEKILAEEYGINEKTIQRDLQEIRKYLKKMS